MKPWPAMGAIVCRAYDGGRTDTLMSGLTACRGRRRERVHVAQVLGARLQAVARLPVRDDIDVGVHVHRAPVLGALLMRSRTPAAFGVGPAADEHEPCPLEVFERAMLGATGCE